MTLVIETPQANVGEPFAVLQAAADPSQLENAESAYRIAELAVQVRFPYLACTLQSEVAEQLGDLAHHPFSTNEREGLLAYLDVAERDARRWMSRAEAGALRAMRLGVLLSHAATVSPQRMLAALAVALPRVDRQVRFEGYLDWCRGDEEDRSTVAAMLLLA